MSLISKSIRDTYEAFHHNEPAPPPQGPNPNDAANAAAQQTAALRARRGMLSNIFGQAQQGQPTVGTSTLGR